MAGVEATMSTKRVLIPVELGEEPTDTRIMQVWVVVYPDFRVDGFSSALFGTESSARSFASHKPDCRLSSRWVTLADFMRLRKQHRL